MANLAIKGHESRGNEVIEILEMLGGINTYACKAVRETCFYFIVEGEIDYDVERYITDEYTIFTLEEFLEKFPYKVGDKVQRKGATSCGSVFNIEKMYWDGEEVVYVIGNEDMVQCSLATHRLQPYKEETMEKENKSVFDANAQCCDIMNHLIKEETMEEKDNWAKWDLPDGYEFQDKDGNIINTSVIRLVKKQLQYPKTYEECCKVLDMLSDWHLTFELNNATSRDLCVKNGFDYVCRLEAFRKLLICRDAYWKIAGDWKPNWEDTSQSKHSIWFNNEGIRIKSNRISYAVQHILTFPTEEMRDAFLENFKNLIESCKELL